MGVFSYGPKNEFETAMVNEPSVFEPLKFYCSLLMFYICTVFHENIFHSMKVIEIREDTVFMQNTTMEHNSVNVGEVMSSDDVLFYAKFHKNISKIFKIMEQTRFLY